MSALHYGQVMSEFDQARLRVERAGQHAAEMAEVWNDYLAPHPFDYSLVRESPRSYIMRVSQITPVPPTLSVIFGEWLFNMRSALDYIIWATAVHTSGHLPPTGEGGLQYPIYDDEAAWKKNEWRLKPLGEHHRQMLLMMQPFNSDLDANFLGWINRLARIDRHRRLTIWTARLGEANPVVKVPSGKTPRLEWGRKVFDNGVCDMARISFQTPSDAEGVEFNPRCAIDPEIAEWSDSKFWGRTRFPERLNWMSVFVSAEIDVYEYDCTGEAASADVVTDSFRAESDARRVAGFFPPRRVSAESAVEWAVATSAPKKATESKFQGVDYPPNGPGR